MNDIKKLSETFDDEVTPPRLTVVLVRMGNTEDVEYIRLDIAKERESKLVRAAYYYPASLVEAETIEDAATLLHKKARIEELK